MRAKSIVMLLLLFFLSGCSSQATTEKPALQQYLEDKGYLVLSYEGTSETYQLTNDKLTRLPYEAYWGVQTVDAAKYLGKTITVEKFIVENHPLAKGKVDCYVYVADGQPFGGTSYPDGAELLGGYYSLDGKTLEEVHQVSSFPDWQQEWQARFQK